ncbi:MAG: hypothetical protein E6H82_02950 [Chloroflexi bacterium]|nr:MAG: hypothetical protein E6H82_02950 [Chloroflexota bacterium]
MGIARPGRPRGRADRRVPSPGRTRAVTRVSRREGGRGGSCRLRCRAGRRRDARRGARARRLPVQLQRGLAERCGSQAKRSARPDR